METPETGTRNTIKRAYVEYVLEQGKQPPSPFVIAKQLGITETAFYGEYNSLEAVESDLWLGFFEAALGKTQSQEVYEGYSVREKLLSFYYTWIEVLKSNRSFVLATAKNFGSRQGNTPNSLKPFRQAFKRFIEELIREGRATGEVANRPLLIDRYADGFWMQALFVLQFWVKDPSKGFEQTDAAIEKAVNTSFDLVGPSVIDSALDFAKFLFQNRN